MKYDGKRNESMRISQAGAIQDGSKENWVSTNVNLESF